MRPLLALPALLVLALAATPASAGGCVVATDPAGDVLVSRTAPSTDGNLDLRNVTLRTTRTGLVLGVDVTKLDQAAIVATWGLRFTVRGKELAMWATAQHDVVHAPESFYAGQPGAANPVRGRVDYAANHVEVVAPYSAFGNARLSRSDKLTNVAGYARARYVNSPQAELRADDEAARTTALALSRC